jgi:hypothetical protein
MNLCIKLAILLSFALLSSCSIRNSDISLAKTHRTLTKSGKGNTDKYVMANNAPDKSKVAATVAQPSGLPSSIKLLIGAGGIYAAFLYYGTLQVIH